MQFSFSTGSQSVSQTSSKSVSEQNIANQVVNQKGDRKTKQQYRLIRRMQGFTFFGGGVEATETSYSQDYAEKYFLASGKKSSTYNELKSFPLANATVGQLVRLAWFNGGNKGDFLSRGMIPGTEFQVISHKSSGSVIIQIGDRRIGLGKVAAKQVMVTVAEVKTEI